MEDFPLPIEDEVFYCGFNAESSFGANSYFIRHPEKLAGRLAALPAVSRQKLEALGGIRYPS
jgi:hypothetical protein